MYILLLTHDVPRGTLVYMIASRLTHEERRERRRRLARAVADRMPQVEDIAAVIAREEGVSLALVLVACREHGVRIVPPTKLPTSKVDQGPADPATAS